MTEYLSITQALHTLEGAFIASVIFLLAMSYIGLVLIETSEHNSPS